MFSYNSKIKYILIVAAAGVGKRMGLNYPKQFLEYNKRPLFINVLEIAENSSVVDEIIVVANKEIINKVKELCKEYKINKIRNVVLGGDERQNSIYNALKYCDEDSIIAVQDGVRPFIREKYFEESLEILKNDMNISGIVIGVPTKDTVKIIDEAGIIISTPIRKNVIVAQTPQVFRGKILKSAYEKAKKENFLGTDDSSLVERIGGKVKIVLGDYENIKLTTIDDIKFLK